MYINKYMWTYVRRVQNESNEYNLVYLRYYFHYSSTLISIRDSLNSTSPFNKILTHIKIHTNSIYGTSQPSKTIFINTNEIQHRLPAVAHKPQKIANKHVTDKRNKQKYNNKIKATIAVDHNKSRKLLSKKKNQFTKYLNWTASSHKLTTNAQ